MQADVLTETARHATMPKGFPMSTLNLPLQESEIIATLDALVAAEDMQANCMFQLAIMMARIALEPASENYKEDTAQSLLALIRRKPKSNVVPLFGAGGSADRPLVRQTLSS